MVSGIRHGLIGRRLAQVAAALAVALVGAVGFAVPAAAATTFTVTTTSDTEDCTSGTGADGQLSLREALCEARAAGTGTVSLPAGTYPLRKALSIDGIDRNDGNGAAEVRVAVTGAAAGSTIIDGNDADRVFNLDESLVGNLHVSLSNLTIRNGTARHDEALGYGGGGGIIAGAPGAAVRDTLALSDCTVSGNTHDTDPNRTTSPGGGIQMTGGDLSITNCTFSGNDAGSSNGGGVFFAADSGNEALTITGSTFSGNTVTNTSSFDHSGGGALAVQGATPNISVTDTDFVDNTATATSTGGAFGGAVHAHDATPTITGSTFTGNRASATGGGQGQGGALFAAGAHGGATVSYSRIAGNIASHSGSGITQSGSTAGTTANVNWWGCNAGPADVACDRVGATVTATQYLRLAVTAAPASIAAGGNTTATAAFRVEPGGAAVPANKLTALRKPTLTWTAVKGVLSSQQAQIQGDGKATATFTGDVGGGAGSVSAKVDGETVTAAIAVAAAPAITTQPSNGAVAGGASVSFAAAASGSPTPTVQWQVSADGGTTWTSVSGATSPTLTFTAALDDDGNRYRAVFTNANGTITSNAATLAVGNPPVVTTQPTDQTVEADETATFTAAASGTPTPTVQWEVSDDGTNWVNLTGKTATTLTLTATATEDGNRYRAKFTNSMGSATTNDATLTVHSAASVTTNPGNQTVNPGDTATFTAAASGKPAPTVQWQVSDNNGTTWTDLTGKTATTLSLTATAPDSGKRYRAVFTNSVNTATTSAATLTVRIPPAMVADPDDATVNAGETATFTATAGGAPSPTVQWQVSTDAGATWSPMTGKTATTLTFTATAGQTGSRYRAVFTNLAGNVTSSEALLTVRTRPVVTADPADVAVDVGDPATFTVDATGSPTPTVAWEVSTDGTTWTVLAGETSKTLTLATAAAGQHGNRYRAKFTNAAGNATTLPATLTVRTAPVVTTDPADQTVSAGGSVSFTAAASGSPAPTVQWAVSEDAGTTWSALTGETATTLTFTATADQDGNRYKATFTNALGSVTSAHATLTIGTGPLVTTQPVSRTVTAGDSVSFSAAASGLPTPTVRWQESTDGTAWADVPGATATTLTFTASAARDGHRFRAVFTNSGGGSTTNAATLTVRTVPVVTAGPADQTAAPGETVAFTAAATGSPIPTVRWQESTDGTWADVAGAAATTLTFTASAAQDGHGFRAVFTNAVGSDTTRAATLTVRSTPVVTTSPADRTVTAGDAVSFAADATGTPAPTVRWQHAADGTTWTDLAGETTRTLTFTATAAQDGNAYRAVFTNPAGTATTAAATLTVNSPPIVVEQPRNETTQPGQAVTFTVDVTGTPTPTVQWQVSRAQDNHRSAARADTWTAIAGATSETLTFVPTRADNGNRYRAQLTNALGVRYSTPATLTVRAAGPIPPTPRPTPTPGPSGTGRPSPLAVTGQDLAALGAVALLLLVGGTAITVVARRRREG